MAFTGVGTAAGQVASGVKVIASAGKRRPTLMPHVPTVIESGYPDYYASRLVRRHGDGGHAAGDRLPTQSEARRGRIVSTIPATLSNLGSEQTLELTDQFSRSLEAERTLWKSIAKEANVQITE